MIDDTGTGNGPGAYVIYSAPYDTLELRKKVEQFNLKTWSIDTIKKHKGGYRLFFRKTKYMTKDFKEGGQYDPVFSSWNNTMDIRNHYDDRIMETKYHLCEDRGYYRCRSD